MCHSLFVSKGCYDAAYALVLLLFNMLFKMVFAHFPSSGRSIPLYSLFQSTRQKQEGLTMQKPAQVLSPHSPVSSLPPRASLSPRSPNSSAPAKWLRRHMAGSGRARFHCSSTSRTLLQPGAGGPGALPALGGTGSRSGSQCSAAVPKATTHGVALATRCNALDGWSPSQKTRAVFPLAKTLEKC